MGDRNKVFSGQNEKNQWYTPSLIIEKARRVMGGIDLDPASCLVANKVVKATEFYSKDDNGLLKKWEGRIWMNPPFSNGLITLFANKLLEELPKIESAIVLTDSHSDTSWFYNLTQSSSALCITKGRLRFWQKVKTFNIIEGTSVEVERECTPRHGQALFYFGKDVAAFCHEFKDVGNVLIPLLTS